MKLLMIKKYCKASLLLCVLLTSSAMANTAPANTETRLVTIGGGLTEIFYALGVEDQIVGVDTTSKWPEEAMKKAQVGYQRKLSAEGILSLQPTSLMVTDSAGPPEVLDQIKNAGIPITVFTTEYSVAGVIKNIRIAASVVNKSNEGEALVDKINTEYESLRKKLETLPNKPSVAFFLGMGKGSPMVAGNNTGADKMIELAGGSNAFKGVEDYKQISTESMIAAAPEIILIAGHAAKGKKLDEILNLKSIAQTPAAKNNKVIIVDTLLMLGYGPRIVDAIGTLTKQIHNVDNLNVNNLNVNNSPLNMDELNIEKSTVSSN